MKFFAKEKPNGDATAAPAALPSEILRRQIEPEMVILETLKNDLEKAQSQQAALRAQADAAKDEDELATVRRRQDFIAQSIEKLKASITAKRAEIQPLKQAYENARNAELKAQQDAEAAAFVNQTREEIYAAFSGFMRSKDRFNELMNELRKRGFHHESQRIMMDLDMRVANNGNNGRM